MQLVGLFIKVWSASTTEIPAEKRAEASLLAPGRAGFGVKSQLSRGLYDKVEVGSTIYRIAAKGIVKMLMPTESGCDEDSQAKQERARQASARFSLVGFRTLIMILVASLAILLGGIGCNQKHEFEYTLQPDFSLTIDKYRGPGGDLVIPEEIAGLRVKSIGWGAFMHCLNLTSVRIPDSVTSIGRRAFGDCARLVSINVDENNSAFRSLDGVLFDKKLETLIQFPGGKSGAYNIPSGATSIGAEAFAGSKSLTSVAIPDGLTSIGYGAFWLNESLVSIQVGEQNPAYSSVDGVLFDKKQKTLIQYPGGKSGGYTIPKGVTSIGDMSFTGCRSSSVTIPDSVRSIGGGAFAYCRNLEAVIFEHITPPELGEYLFDGSDKARIYVPENATGWPNKLGGGFFHNLSGGRVGGLKVLPISKLPR